MTLEKKFVDAPVIDALSNEVVIEQKEIYVETITETKEIVWHKDRIESLITQKTSDRDNLQNEID